MTGAEVRSDDVRLGPLRINIAQAPGASTGVLLYPTIMGLNQTMRDFATEFAGVGMTAVVWDPYNGDDASGGPMEMLDRSRQCEDHNMVRDLRLVADHMHGPLGLESIFGIGWCFGGRVGLLHAGSDDRVDALSAYNPTIFSPTPVDIPHVGRLSRADFPGQTMDEFALASAVRGPVQVCRPEHDFTQPAEYQRLVDTLFGRPWPTMYEYYPAAEHGFSYSPGEHNEKAHRFAWRTTTAMFSASVAGASA